MFAFVLQLKEISHQRKKKKAERELCASGRVDKNERSRVLPNPAAWFQTQQAPCDPVASGHVHPRWLVDNLPLLTAP